MTHPILVIEDNEQNRYMITFLLERSGYAVRAVADGARGIEVARAVSPVLIILDIQLPMMDGYSVARALRRIDSLRCIPIVAVTSYATADDRERALEAGCTAYIEKPIDPETFVTEMELALVRSNETEP